MKCSLFLIILLLVTQSFANELKHDIGFKIAITRSKIINNNSYYRGISTQSRTGMNFALVMNIYHSKHLNISPQIEYSQRGYTLSYNNEYDQDNYYKIEKADARFDYISIPIFIKFVIPNTNISSFASAGIRFEHIINEERAKVSTPEVSSTDYSENPTLRDTNLGISFMLGFEIKKLLPFITTIDLRYNIDFGRLISSGDEYQNGYTKNQSFDLWLGVLF